RARPAGGVRSGGPPAGGGGGTPAWRAWAPPPHPPGGRPGAGHRRGVGGRPPAGTRSPRRSPARSAGSGRGDPPQAIVPDPRKPRALLGRPRSDPGMTSRARGGSGPSRPRWAHRQAALVSALALALPTPVRAVATPV